MPYHRPQHVMNNHMRIHPHLQHENTLPQPKQYFQRGNNYLSLANYHGSGARKVYCTDIREVCWNTHSRAIGIATKEDRVWSCRHTLNALRVTEASLNEAREILKLSLSHSKALEALANQLVSIRISDEQFQRFAEELFPVCTRRSDNTTERQQLLVEEKRALLFKAADAQDLANFRRTAWGALGAVTAYQSHVTQGNDRSNPDTLRARQESRISSSSSH